MGYCRSDCGKDYTCTAWDGKEQATHNLVKECPRAISKCKYRKKKIKAIVFGKGG